MKTSKTITIKLQDDEIRVFFRLIGKAENYNLSKLTRGEAELLAELHEIGIDEGIIPE